MLVTLIMIIDNDRLKIIIMIVRMIMKIVMKTMMIVTLIDDFKIT